ncbi:helix-turn-helix domain-containing protein [Allokutzneria sp. A3M-2-11 16]|uniref:helix-turn-helix domain-containing protein n=1 Tax=Allokutzneria sp. A3M-2-11 16 TaxID=2962043 RepID=UPI0020B886E3|nr:helix-turn-helix transcriptional regulator [Allokutzneria sp. A3M-2-11 16]MCP3800345.1 helix-turn-helix domain-containing protein [Allokutzneria sp. A3M-2-11 16]
MSTQADAQGWALLHSLRDEKGLTFRALAEASGLSVSQLWKLAAGRQRPTDRTAAKLAAGLGVETSALVRQCQCGRLDRRESRETVPPRDVTPLPKR